MAGEPEVELQECAAAASPGCVPEDARSGAQLVVMVVVIVVTNGGCRYRVWLHYAVTITITIIQVQDTSHSHIQRLEAW